MKKLLKLTVLSGLALGVFAVTPAQAHEDESCFSQKTVSGWVRVCSENDGGFEFNLGTYGDRRNDRHDDRYRRPEPVKQVVYYPVGYFVPPGHHKQDWHHKYRKHHKDGKHHYHHNDHDRHDRHH